MDSKLAPFAEMLGKLPDAKIAEMAGVDVALVVEARGDTPAPSSDAPPPKGKGKLSATKIVEEIKKSAKAAPSSPATPPAPAPKPPAAPKAAKAPKPPKPPPASAPEPAAEPVVAPPHLVDEAPTPPAPPKVLRLKKGVRISKGGIDRFLPRSIYRGDAALRIWNDPDVSRDLIEVLER